jgi:hypothetical protein
LRQRRLPLFEPVFRLEALFGHSQQTLSQELSAAQWSHTSALFRCGYHGCNLRTGDSVARMWLDGQPEPLVDGAFETHHGGLIAKMDGVVHVAISNTGIGRTRVRHGSARQIAIIDQTSLSTHGRDNGFVDERLAESVQDSANCLGFAHAQTLQRSAHAAVVCPSRLLPGQRNGSVLVKRMTIPADVFQMGQTSQDGDQKLDHLGLWTMRPHLLLQWHGV